MFSIKLSNGKEACFNTGAELADWYHKEKRAALSVDDVRKKDRAKKTKEKSDGKE